MLGAGQDDLIFPLWLYDLLKSFAASLLGAD